MKKYFNVSTLIIGLLVVASIILFVQNSHFRAENKSLSNKIDTTEKEQDQEGGIHLEVNDMALEFLRGYFEFDGFPDENNVNQLVKPDVLETMSFNFLEEGMEDFYGDIEGKGINSNVRDERLYYGLYTEDKQEVMIVFDNVIEVDGLESSSMSVINLHFLKEGDGWIIEHFNFTQF